MSFGENLQIIRKQKSLSQEALAEMLGVSRQAVSKWELGEGYPEVDKLLLLSRNLDVSVDALLGNEAVPAATDTPKPSGKIRIVSPNEGVIITTSRVTRSQEFRGGSSSPKYALFASEENGQSFWGAQNTFLAWYRNLEDVTAEIEAIRKAMDAGEESYSLQYSVKCRKNLLRVTIEE